MGCPDIDILTEYLEGVLAEEGRHEVECHIDSCSDCRWIVAESVGRSFVERLDGQAAPPLEPEPSAAAVSREGPIGPAGTSIADRYTLNSQLGQGGMGAVWVATDRRLRREVAVKLMDPSISRSAAAVYRFEHEAMAVARLRSPHIVQVYDYGIHEDTPFIVMELLEGCDLREHLERYGRLGVDEAAWIIRHVSKALQVAHEAGMVHRDLKPANLFLVEHRDGVQTKVFDFGVVKGARGNKGLQDTTGEGVLLGTPRYMSPEQCQGAAGVDARSDLWALGVIAYRMLTGEMPFDGIGLADVIVAITTRAPRPPSQLRQDLPAKLDAFFSKALAKQPAARFQSAEELAFAFMEAADVSLPSGEYAIPNLFDLASRSGSFRSVEPDPGNEDPAASSSSRDKPSSSGRNVAFAAVALGLVAGAVWLGFQPPTSHDRGEALTAPGHAIVVDKGSASPPAAPQGHATNDGEGTPPQRPPSGDDAAQNDVPDDRLAAEPPVWRASPTAAEVEPTEPPAPSDAGPPTSATPQAKGSANPWGVPW